MAKQDNNSSSGISVNLQDLVGLGNIAFLEKLTRSFLDEQRLQSAKIDIYTMDDEMISMVNDRVFGINDPTDVITVPFGNNPILEAEIFLGVSEIERNSQVYGTGFRYELAFCLIHGLLHAMGWQDDTEDGREAMFEYQRRFLGRYEDWECG